MRFEVWRETQGMTFEAFRALHPWAFAPRCQDADGRPLTAAEVFAVLGRDRTECVAATDTPAQAEVWRRAQGSLPRERVTVRPVAASLVHVAELGRWARWSDGVLTAARDLSPAMLASPPRSLAPEVVAEFDARWDADAWAPEVPSSPPLDDEARRSR